jgi:hypothetical protein
MDDSIQTVNTCRPGMFAKVVLCVLQYCYSIGEKINLRDLCSLIEALHPFVSPMFPLLHKDKIDYIKPEHDNADPYYKDLVIIEQIKVTTLFYDVNSVYYQWAEKLYKKLKTGCSKYIDDTPEQCATLYALKLFNSLLEVCTIRYMCIPLKIVKFVTVELDVLELEESLTPVYMLSDAVALHVVFHFLPSNSFEWDLLLSVCLHGNTWAFNKLMNLEYGIVADYWGRYETYIQGVIKERELLVTGHETHAKEQLLTVACIGGSTKIINYVSAKWESICKCTCEWCKVHGGDFVFHLWKALHTATTSYNCKLDLRWAESYWNLRLLGTRCQETKLYKSRVLSLCDWWSKVPDIPKPRARVKSGMTV